MVTADNDENIGNIKHMILNFIYFLKRIFSDNCHR